MEFELIEPRLFFRLAPGSAALAAAAVRSVRSNRGRTAATSAVLEAEPGTPVLGRA
jgi:hypothetical protein